MATREFKLPDIGEGLTEAEIVRWLVAEGDRVQADRPLVEVETDKAVVEIPSPYSGVVLRHGGAEGDTLEVGQVLVVIGDEEDVAAADTGEPEAESEPDEAAEPGPEGDRPIVGTLSEEAEVLGSITDPPGRRSAQVKALPLVRKLARDHDVDLTEIEGSGPGGRITREDVEAAIGFSGDGHREEPEPAAAEELEPQEASGARPPDEEVGPAPYRGEGERRHLSRLRRTIAANMSKSWSEIPHVTTFDDVDATRLVEVRAALSHRYDMKIPMESLVVKAVIPALREYPDFNATLDGDELIVHSRHDIGIAVDTPDGLLVAVIRDGGSLSVIELAEEVHRLGEGAKSRSLGPDELTGQTFTVSNIGAVGGGHGTPIVPHGTVAILSVGRAKEKPIVFDGDLVIAPVMPLSLSYDHRVIDGAMGRRFISLVMENLEEPALFLSV